MKKLIALSLIATAPMFAQAAGDAFGQEEAYLNYRLEIAEIQSVSE